MHEHFRAFDFHGNGLLKIGKLDKEVILAKSIAEHHGNQAIRSHLVLTQTDSLVEKLPDQPSVHKTLNVPAYLKQLNVDLKCVYKPFFSLVLLIPHLTNRHVILIDYFSIFIKNLKHFELTFNTFKYVFHNSSPLPFFL